MAETEQSPDIAARGLNGMAESRRSVFQIPFKHGLSGHRFLHNRCISAAASVFWVFLSMSHSSTQERNCLLFALGPSFTTVCDGDGGMRGIAVCIELSVADAG